MNMMENFVQIINMVQRISASIYTYEFSRKPNCTSHVWWNASMRHMTLIFTKCKVTCFWIFSTRGGFRKVMAWGLVAQHDNLHINESFFHLCCVCYDALSFLFLRYMRWHSKVKAWALVIICISAIGSCHSGWTKGKGGFLARWQVHQLDNYHILVSLYF